MSKTANGDEEILIQGDVSYDVRPLSSSDFPRVSADALDEWYVQVEEMILDHDNKKLMDVFLGKIDGDQIELIEEKPKKKPPPTIAPQ